MSDSDKFPRKRFVDAKVEPALIDVLEEEFESSDLSARTHLAKFYAERSTAMLGAHVRQLDDSGHFSHAPRDAASGAAEGSEGDDGDDGADKDPDGSQGDHTGGDGAPPPSNDSGGGSGDEDHANPAG